jgi:hypothetical protein
MAIPDLSGLTDADLQELQKKAGEEQFKRTQNAQIQNAANDLITQAKFAGYTKTQVKTYLSNLIDSIYAA